MSLIIMSLMSFCLKKLLMSEILYFLIKFRISPAYRTGVHSTRERFSEQFGICVRSGFLCHLLTL